MVPKLTFEGAYVRPGQAVSARYYKHFINSNFINSTLRTETLIRDTREPADRRARSTVIGGERGGCSVGERVTQPQALCAGALASTRSA